MPRGKSKYRINEKSIAELIKLFEGNATYEEAEGLYIYLQQLAEICYNHLKKAS